MSDWIKTTENEHYIIVERQHGPDVMIAYPDYETAEWALVMSSLVDAICEEDCLDAIVAADPPEGWDFMEFYYDDVYWEGTDD